MPDQIPAEETAGGEREPDRQGEPGQESQAGYADARRFGRRGDVRRACNRLNLRSILTHEHDPKNSLRQAKSPWLKVLRLRFKKPKNK